MGTIARAGTLHGNWNSPFVADCDVCLYVRLVTMFATFIVEVGTQKIAGVVFMYWIDAYHITAMCVLPFKMAVKVFRCQLFKLAIRTVSTFLLFLSQSPTAHSLRHTG